MRKIILSCLTALSIMQTKAQSPLVIDLSTGRYDDYYTNNTWHIPIGTADDTWKVLMPGTNVYTSPFVNDGHEPYSMNSTNTVQDISGVCHPISPYVYTTPPPANPLAGTNGVGDIMRMVNPNVYGKLYYRMQFNFSKDCKTITSAQININLLTGQNVSKILLNGYSYALPSYPILFPGAESNYLNIWDAWWTGTSQHFSSAPSGYLPNPHYLGAIPQKVITLNPGDFANGLNSLWIEVDTDDLNLGGFPSKMGVLMVDANLEINYTPIGSNNTLFNMTGSSSNLCNGATGQLNVGLNVANPSTYNLQITPGVYSGPGFSTQQQININPSASTNYVISMTSPAGCVTQLNWPVTVRPLPFVGPSSTICLGDPLNFLIDCIGCNVKIKKVGGPVFSNINISNPQISISPGPTVTTTYIITVTDIYGCIYNFTRTITVLPHPICDAAPRFSGTTGLESISDNTDVISVSPNPSQSVFTLNTNNLTTGEISVFDISGKKIMEIKIGNETSEYKIDLTNKLKGIYLVHIDSEDKHFSKKIILE